MIKIRFRTGGLNMFQNWKCEKWRNTVGIGIHSKAVSTRKRED